MWRKGLLLAVLLGLGGWMWTERSALTQEQIESWLSQMGIWAPLAYMGLYVLAAVLMLPGSVLTLLAGALFGPVWGVLWALLGATLGATLAFLTSRYLAAEWAEAKAKGVVRKVKDGVEFQGWRFVAFARLVPAIPFNLLNYALGLTRIKVWHYALTSFVAMLPAGVVYVYIGHVGREALEGNQGWLSKAALGLGLLLALSLLPLLMKRMRQGGGASS